MSQTLLLRQTQKSSQLHTVLRERLRERLATQGPGERISSERILAKEFGVSTATVSKALQELELEGILCRIPGKGTYLSGGAEAKANVREREALEGEGFATPQAENSLIATTIGSELRAAYAPETDIKAWIVVQLEDYETSIDRISEFWPPRIVSRLEYRITEGGGKAQITIGHTLTEDQCRQVWQAALDQGVNCVFFVVNDRNPMLDVWIEQFAQRYLGAGRNQSATKPPVIVQILLSAMPLPYFDNISFDGEWGSYLAATHLLELGHRHIVFLAPPLNFYWLDHRIRGFHRALRSYGVPVPRGQLDYGVVRTPAVPDGPRMWQDMGEAVAAQIAADATITAVMAVNDQMASAFLDRTRRLGRAVPESLSVVGYDDWFESGMRGLTTVHPPIDELADAALNIARRRLAEVAFKEDIHLHLKPTLMVRNSTAPVSA